MKILHLSSEDAQKSGSSLQAGVVTDPESAKTLYDGNLKILISAEDLRIAEDILGYDENRDLYVCERKINSVYIYHTSPLLCDERLALDSPPPLCLAVIALSTRGRTDLEYLRDLWSGGGDGFLPQILSVDAENAPALAATIIYRELMNNAVTLCRSVASRLVNLQQQVSSFRLIHEQLQNAFDTVENFLSRSQTPPTWLAFSSEPTEAATGPVNADGPFEVAQVLPVPTQGIAAIEIHATRIDAYAEGALFVRVDTQEDNRLLGSWKVPYQALADGWIYLDLAEIDIAPRQSALLKVVWQTDSGSPPLLSLSSLQPVSESRARSGQTPDSQRSLAVRVHLGLPGARRVIHPLQIQDRVRPVDGTTFTRIRLAPSILRNFIELGFVATRGPLAKLIEEGGAIELRAPQDRPTVVKLQGGLPAGANLLSATIKSAGSEHSAGEHALIALPRTQSYETVLKNDGVGNHGGAFSGWLRVQSESTTQIHIQLPKRSEASLDIYLATRAAAGSTVTTVIAQWLELVVGFP